ncbi:MAG: 4-hydroxy-tetrahydrodipicolinate synthase [Odoribacter sp.]|nr:4-hydroxy-tetrahydrodipicolinate synthase [Odoribacter sp.]
MERLDGTGVALVTPFDEDLQIDEFSLRRLVNHVIEGGVDFLVVLGTTAECATLSEEEKTRVVRIVVEENRGRLPIMAGIGGNNTQEVIREINRAEWLKDCQAILSITPFYNKPSQTGLFEHFKAIAEVSPLPLCLYNVPGRTGVNMQAATLAKLSRECPRIFALKESSGDFGQATAILRQKRSDMLVFSGDDAIVLPLMALGFDGVISVVANVMPRECSALVNYMKNGHMAEARQLHLSLSVFCKLLFEEGNPAGVKAALCAAGVIRHNRLRLPLTPVSETLFEKIRQEMA